MHELSIAQNIIDMIQQHIPEHEWNQVTAVRLKIGASAGIVPDSLEFSFHAITSGSALCHARLITERIPFRVQCRTCSAITENDEGFALCSACQGADIQILSGTELQMTEIEMIEAAGTV
jgi:hydrogenase nickel incorporation protein HypA/HybF